MLIWRFAEKLIAASRLIALASPPSQATQTMQGGLDTSLVVSVTDASAKQKWIDTCR